MTFSNLWPLGFLILIPVIILLYLLKQKVKDQPFSSTLLWQEIYKNLEAKTPFEKLKQNILMYLQILAMLLLILALMAPVIRNGGLVSRNTILVVDTSASMETMYNGGKTRLDESISRARNYLDGVNDSTTVTIVACGDEPELIYQGQDKSAAKKKLGGLEVKQVSGTLDGAAGMVGSLVSNLDNVEVICYTDSEFDYESWKRNNDKISLAVESIYSPAENLSVDYVNYALRDASENSEDNNVYEDGSVIETICKVTNHGTEKAVTDVSLYLDNEIMDVQTISVEAGESEIVYFSDIALQGDEWLSDGSNFETGSNGDSNARGRIKEGLVLRAELSEKDALTADNISSVAVTSNENRKILLISESNVFLEKALSLVDGAEVYKAEDISVLQEAEDFSLYVFDGVAMPDEFDLSKLNDKAGVLLINYDSASLEKVFDGIKQSESGSVLDCMLHFEKSDITEYVEDYLFGVTKAYTYALPEWGKAIISTEAGDVVGYYGRLYKNNSHNNDVGSINAGNRRIGIIGFDIHNTDLALQTEFPIFMSQLTEYLLIGDELQAEVSNFPVDESEVIPIDDVRTEGILDKTRTGGRAIRNILLWLSVVILIIEWIIYHLQVHSGKKRQFLFVRAILLSLILLAIAGVSVTKRQQKVETIFLVDVSDSMSGNLSAVEKYLKDNMAVMPKKNQAGIVLFGKNTAVEQFVSDSRGFYGFSAAPITTATNIGSAVTSACSMFHDGVTKRLVLISDGCENEGSMSLAAAAVKGSDVELIAIPLEDSLSGSSEVYIDGLETPSVIHEGDHYNIYVSVKSNVETDALLTIYSGRVSKGQREIHLTKGSNQFVFEDVGEDGTIAQYKAVIEPLEDTLSVNNTYVTFSQIETRPKVLLVEGKEGNTAEYEKILAAANIDYDVVPANGVPVSLSQLNAYKAVITLDVHYDDLRKGFAEVLETYVKDYAGGYICIGGDNSYALGGYRNTELEEILPVDMDILGEKEIPKMAMVMVIDQSGSMAYPSEDNSSVTGLDLAKQAAISGVSELRETDEAGVLAFDDKYNWTVPIETVNDAEDIKDKIRTIGDGGGTSIYPALEEAYAKLLKSDAKIKHIILLTDGQDEFRDYSVLLDRINDADITVSTVAVGTDSDQAMLGAIAENCGGRFYYTDVNNSIPRIFAKEVYLSTNNYLINEEFYPQITSNNEILSGVMEEGCPALLGYIVARAKPRADVILEAQSGDPILSTWQCGLGRTVAWNSDGTNEWTAEFAKWNNYPMLWSNIIHYVISDTELSGDNLEIVNEGGSARIIYETGEFDKDTVVNAVVSDESGNTKEFTLEPAKPGSYQAAVDSDEVGIYNLSIRKRNGDEIVKNYNTAFANQYSPEYQFSDSTGEFERFVKQAEGEELSLEDNVWKSDARRVAAKVPLAMPLIIIAMGLLLFDIMIRRFSIDVWSGIRAGVVRNAKRVRGGFGRIRIREKKVDRENIEGSNIVKPDAQGNWSTNEKVKGKARVNTEENAKDSDDLSVNRKQEGATEKNKLEKDKAKKTKEKRISKSSTDTSEEKLDMNTLLNKKKDRDI